MPANNAKDFRSDLYSIANLYKTTKDLEDLKVQQLRELAKRLSIIKFSQMNKSNLVTAIEDLIKPYRKVAAVKNSPDNVKELPKVEYIPTLSQKIKNIVRKYGSFNDYDLKVLRPIAKELNIKNYSRKDKETLVAELEDCVQIYRKDIAIEQKILKDRDSNNEFDESYFLNHCKKETKPLEIAEHIVNTWENKNLEDTTIAITNPQKINITINRLIYDFPQYEQYLSTVYQLIRAIVRNKRKDINKDYSETVENRGDTIDLIKIDGYLVVNWAKEQIKTACQYPEGKFVKSWYSLSLALAIVTGRRMDEIHGDNCKFMLGEYPMTLRSVGLSKKENDDSEVTAPCLVNPEDWLVAYSKLPPHTLGLHNSQVNDTLSTNISKAIKHKVYPLLNFDYYKTSRDFYVAFVNHWLKPSNVFESLFIKKMVGHDSKRVGRSYEKIAITGDCPINLDDYKEAITALF